jgi:glycosyltransferase involved in cell wall biosynthesis
MSDTVNDVRVLHLDHTRARGGAEYALLRILKRAVWSATLGLPSSDAKDAGVFAPLEGVSNVAVEILGPPQYSGASRSRSVVGLARFASSALRQAASIRRSPAFARADLVHANTSRTAVYAAVAGLGSKKPLVIHLRDMVDRKSLGTVGYALFTRVALRRAAGVIANSQSTLASAEPFLQARSARVVIPSAAGIVAAGQYSPSGHVVARVGMVARLDPWKGQDLLIRAFAEVYGGTDVQLLLAGDAPFGHHDFLSELADLARELGITSQVSFLGHVDDVRAFIDTLDVCVQASVRPEPLGQNILQYLSAGKAIIATSAGGPGEWIQHGRSGLLFEMGNQKSLVENLRRAADASLRRALEAGAAATPGLLTDVEVSKLHYDFFVEIARTR